jgi:hypothetical protein
MGRWGVGNFADDGAMDYVGDLVDRLATTVTEILADEERAALDEEGEAVVMPTVEILALLCEMCGAYPFDGVDAPQSVADWRDRYLQIFDDEIDGLAPREDFKAQRRAVIVQTFERLLKCGRARESEA